MKMLKLRIENWESEKVILIFKNDFSTLEDIDAGAQERPMAVQKSDCRCQLWKVCGPKKWSEQSKYVESSPLSYTLCRTYRLRFHPLNSSPD